MLIWVRRSHVNETAFWTNLWPKFAPKRTDPEQIDDEDQTDPVGTLVDALISEFEQEQQQCPESSPKNGCLAR
jgi:hypothetical protein